jgi:hypothetical protein
LCSSSHEEREKIKIKKISIFLENGDDQQSQVPIGKTTPRFGANAEDMCTIIKIFFSKEIVVPGASLGGTKRLHESDSCDLDK